MKKLVIILLMLLVIIVIALIGIQAMKNVNTPEEVEQEEIVDDPENQDEVIIPTEEEIGNNPIATIQIEGIEEMKFVLFPDAAPQSVYNFIYLANSGFYDGLSMHRIVTDFVAQGGDSTGTGAGPTEYTIKGEFPANGVDTGLTHKKGSIAWARSQDLDSAGTQFYICLANDEFLDPNYAVFGYMISGENALEQLQELSSDSGEPKEPVIIKSVSVDTKGVDYPEPDKILTQEQEVEA